MQESSQLASPHGSSLDSTVTQRQSLRWVLPNEIINLIIQRLSKKEQTIAARVNCVFYAISVRRLYHSIKDLPGPSHWIRCLQTLSQNSYLSSLVRSFGVSFAHFEPTGNLYDLLCKVLRHLRGLISLTIELPKNHSPVWILNGSSFNLQQFTTSMHCKMPLARFLDTQLNIKNLTLRGFHDDNLSFLPLLNSPSNTPKPDEGKFTLLPESLVKLEQLNVVHVEPSIIATVIAGRPVEIVSIPLFPSTVFDSFNALLMSSRPLKRISLISFDPFSPSFLFTEIASRFPDLEALHIVVIMAEYTKELLEDAAPLLSRFNALKYITFMAATTEYSTSFEKSIAKRWQEACPTLKTIILPQGSVWFQGGAEWSCLRDS